MTQKNLSEYMLGTMRYIRDERVTLRDLGGVHGNTLGAILYRKYAERGAPKGMATQVHLTTLGQTELARYEHAQARLRTHSGEITERCATMLRVLQFVRHGERQARHTSHSPTRAAS